MNKLDVLVPAKVLELLKVLQTALDLSHNVVLAGGFLRDTIGGAKIKDLDIVLSPKAPLSYAKRPEDTIKRALAPNPINGYFIAKSVHNTDYLEGMKARGVVSLFMGYSPTCGDMEAQLIVYGKPMTPEQVAKDMDINICQVVLTPEGVCTGTDEFLKGFREGTIEVLNGGKDSEREKARVARMLAKYPHFKVL